MKGRCSNCSGLSLFCLKTWKSGKFRLETFGKAAKTSYFCLGKVEIIFYISLEKRQYDA